MTSSKPLTKRMNRAVQVHLPIRVSLYDTTVAVVMVIVTAIDLTQIDLTQSQTPMRLLITDELVATTQTICLLVCQMISSMMVLIVSPRTVSRTYF